LGDLSKTYNQLLTMQKLFLFVVGGFSSVGHAGVTIEVLSFIPTMKAWSSLRSVCFAGRRLDQDSLLYLFEL
jgi:hypothetical protein